MPALLPGVTVAGANTPAELAALAATQRRLLAALWPLLRPGGRVGIEHDDATSEAVQRALVEHGGFEEVAPLPDLTGTARFVTARRGVQ